MAGHDVRHGDLLVGAPGTGVPMTTAQSARPVSSREVQASVLAALQLVEDARQLGPDRRARRDHLRLVAERTVASRRLARDLQVS